MALREILVHFGFTADKAELDAVDKKVQSVKGHSEEAANGAELLIHAFEAFAALTLVQKTKEWVQELADVGDELGDTAEATGLSTRQLQVWQLGAAQSGEDAQVFTAALRRLAAGLAGGSNEAGTQAATFKRLHIETRNADKSVRNMGEILPEIAEHFHNMQDGAEKSALAQELFGRSGTKLIPLLNRGADGVAELEKQFDNLGGGFDEEAIQRAGEMKEAIANVDVAFNSLKSRLAISLLPRVQEFLGLVENIVGSMTEFARETTLVESAVGSLSTALIVTLGGALAPFIGGALKFAAIYLAVDELVGFLQGKDSVIEEVLNGWFGDGTADVVREWALDAGQSVINFINDARAVFPLFVDDVKIMAEEVMGIWSGMVNSLANAWNGLVHATLGKGTTIEIDTSKHAADQEQRAARIQALEADKDTRFTAIRKYEQDKQLGQVAQVQAPFSNAAIQAPKTSWNMVTNAPQVTINVPSGTPQSQTAAIGRETRAAIQQSHRAAIQALESRGGQ